MLGRTSVKKNWFYQEKVLVLPPSEQSLLLSSFLRRRKGCSAWITSVAFEVAASRTPGLVNLAFSRQTGFFECKHPFVDKPMVITEPAIASARLLSLGSKLYPTSILRMPNKELTRFMQSLFRVLSNQAIERKTLLAGKVVFCSLLVQASWSEPCITTSCCPYCFRRKKKLAKTFFCHIINPLLTKLLVRLSFWPRSLFFLGLLERKGKLGQYAFILSSRLG